MKKSSTMFYLRFQSICMTKKKFSNVYLKSPTIALILFLMLGFVAWGQAQTRQTVLYVDASYTGSTASDGTEAHPFTTIRAALDYRGNVMGLGGMVSDEEIVVKSGTYAPDVPHMIFVTAANGGKGNHKFTLRADGDVVLDGSNLHIQKFAALITVTGGA